MYKNPKYIPERVKQSNFDILKGLFEVDSGVICSSNEINGVLNKLLFDQEQSQNFILKNAKFKIINFHGREKKSPSSMFIYIETNTNNMDLKSLDLEEAVSMFLNKADKQLMRP